MAYSLSERGDFLLIFILIFILILLMLIILHLHRFPKPRPAHPDEFFFQNLKCDSVCSTVELPSERLFTEDDDEETGAGAG